MGTERRIQPRGVSGIQDIKGLRGLFEEHAHRCQSPVHHKAIGDTVALPSMSNLCITFDTLGDDQTRPHLKSPQTALPVVIESLNERHSAPLFRL